jgi:hypothetical protein
MPPEGEPLTSDEIRALRAWIDAGAEAPADEAPMPGPADHWAFRPPARPEVPRPSEAAWGANPIDAFLAAEHERRGLVPVAEADRATLLRRVSIDLTGLAPTPDELEAFLADDSPGAYERVVDRLLESPRYGERWGRHWMDVWRYSDWAGFGAEVRESQPHIWRWRDWIVESLNADAGYDEMLVAMLAGDELAPGDPGTLRATGYLVRNWYKFSRNTWLQDTTDHTAKAMLGLTFGCARCHDHKYDPIRQADYYRLRAVFEPHEIRTDRLPDQPDTTKDGVVRVYDAKPDEPTYLFVRGNEKEPDQEHPLAPGLPEFLRAELAAEPVPLPPSAYYPGLSPIVRREAIAKAEAEVAAARAALDGALLAANRSESAVASAGKRLEAALWGLESLRARIAADDARYAGSPDSKNADVLAWAASRAERTAALRAAEADLARVEAGPADPDPAKAKAAVDEARAKLDAARSAAGTPSGAYSPLSPVYPAASTGRRLALARWIAGRDNPLTARVAVNHIWMRHFGRPIVPTVFDFGLNGRPPTHPELLDWLAVELMEGGWRMKPIHRLIVTSRAYRMRSTGGAESPNASIDPENQALWRMNPGRLEAEAVRDNLLHVAGRLDPAMGGPDLDPSAWMTTPRRSLYFRHAPEKQVLFLTLFDAPNPNACYRRDVSVVPQQALALANSPLAREVARAVAEGLGAAPGSDEAFVASAFVRVLGRPPAEDERAACAGFLAARTDRPSEARASLVLVLLNHNDFVTIR